MKSEIIQSPESGIRYLESSIRHPAITFHYGFDISHLLVLAYDAG